MVNFLKIKDNDLPFFSAVSMGKIPGVQYMFKFGINDNIKNNAFEDIWSAGGIETLLTSPETIDIESDSTKDTLGGKGLQSMVLKGLDGDYNPVQEDIELNGKTPVTTKNKYLRMYRAYGLVSGSSGFNEGNISIKSSDLGTDMGLLVAEENQTQKTQFTIPAGYCGLLLQVEQSGEKGSNWIQRFRMKEYGLSERTIDLINATEQFSSNSFTIPRLIHPKADIKLQAKSTQGSNVEVTASYELMLIRENLVNFTKSWI